MPEKAKNIIDNNLLIIKSGSPLQIETNKSFQELKTKITELIEESSKINKVSINDLDEDQITEFNKKTRSFNKEIKPLKDARKEFSKYLTNTRKTYLAQLDEILKKAGYEELEQNIQTMKEHRKEYLNNRINKRWAQLKQTFDKNISIYPIIKQMAPKLADFNTYQLTHSDLVSGAKSKPVNDKMRSVINNELHQYATSLRRIQENSDQLLPAYQQQVLDAYIEQPTADNLLDVMQSVKQKQALDQQNLQMNSATQNNNQMLEAPAQNTNNQAYIENQQENNLDFSWLIDYCMNNADYQQIHNNNVAKASLLYDMMTNLMNQNSIWYTRVGTDANLVTATAQYILNM